MLLVHLLESRQLIYYISLSFSPVAYNVASIMLTVRCVQYTWPSLCNSFVTSVFPSVASL